MRFQNQVDTHDIRAWAKKKIPKYDKLERKSKMTDILRDTFKTHDRKTDAVSTMSSIGHSLSPLQLMVEKLNGKNFLEWTQSIWLVLDDNNKLVYLIDATPKPTSIDSISLQKWTSKNSMVTAWLVNLMQSTINKIFLFLSTTTYVWDAIWETPLKFLNSKPNSGKWSKEKKRLLTTSWRWLLSERSSTSTLMTSGSVLAKVHNIEKNWDKKSV